MAGPQMAKAIGQKFFCITVVPSLKLDQAQNILRLRFLLRLRTLYPGSALLCYFMESPVEGGCALFMGSLYFFVPLVADA
jgi:hypothetical protein